MMQAHTNLLCKTKMLCTDRESLKYLTHDAIHNKTYYIVIVIFGYPLVGKSGGAAPSLSIKWGLGPPDTVAPSNGLRSNYHYFVVDFLATG